MSDRLEPRPRFWPFILADVLLLAMAGAVVREAEWPLDLWRAGVLFLCVSTGACFSLWPFLLMFKAEARLAEAEELKDLRTHFQELNEVKHAIRDATGNWQSIQDESANAARSVKDVVERMTTETREFFQFLERADRTEKQTLKVEVEKLRRAEQEWLQAMIHIFDHIFALNKAAVNSGNANLAAQLGQFQNACRDAGRRLGLIPFVPTDGEKFDNRAHDLAEKGAAGNGDGAVVRETFANGYLFQGRMVRKALVDVGEPEEEEGEVSGKKGGNAVGGGDVGVGE